MRKYLLNGALISAVLGFIPLLRKSRDSSTAAAIIQWVLWGASVAMAVLAIRQEAQSERLDVELN